MAQIAKAVVDAGIAWAIINNDVDYITPCGSVRWFRFLQSCPTIRLSERFRANSIGAFLGEQGCVLYIEGPSVRDVAKVRSAGMLAAKPKGVSIKNLRGDWTQKSGYHAAKSWLSLSTSRHLQVGMVVCQNDDMAIGARRAFEEVSNAQEREQWLRLPFTGCDGVPRSGQKSGCGKEPLSATVVTPPLVGDALRLLTSALKAGSQPAERTLVAPSSFPAVKELQKARAAASP